eukprot:CAMPEP_0197434520 /NCGR_PEP_ID=MMETSP1175-20131217/2231_1 /TAXON_ID=1003142 /ORGANISM="Triceratium dubium, Strain CCMP147" /LENGTH=221 /DNA_ID=CAMNT_0042963269 /DNA_START=152 /DNA_END=817 /DNA_ORIENTATION=-
MTIENLKLTYFAIPGRGESIRLALKLNDTPFEDNRVEFSQWKELKPTTPFGSLPYVELADGTVIAQQRAILRLVGKETGLYPEDPVAAAKVDQLCDVCDDLQGKVNSTGQGLAQAEKEAARKEAVTTGNVADILKQMDACIAKNGSGGHAVGDKLTIADLMILTVSCALVCGLFDGVPETMFEPFENIMAVRKNVANNAKISPYLEEMKEKKFYGAYEKAK